MEQTLTQWEDGWRVRLPLPFQLKWIHAYLIKGSDGFTIVDCGLNDDAAWQTWQGVFRHLNLQSHDIKRIVLTHYHPDHYGMAGRLQRWTGADVWLAAETRDKAQQFWGLDSQHLQRIAAYYGRHGLPQGTATELVTNLGNFRNWVSPHPENPRLLDKGSTIRLGDRPYEVWHTPGHAEDHLSFYDHERQWLIGGDVLLRKITPNISLYPNGDPNPLHTFLKTLHHLEQKPIRQVLPAHGPVFSDVQERIREIIDHHEQRLQHIERLADGVQNAYDICLKLFGDGLSIHNLRFAMAETLAHLEYLHQNGRLSLMEKGDDLFYARS